MTADYQVTPEQVTAAATTVSTKAGDIQEQLNSLKAYIVNLEDSWQGIAHARFLELMQEYDTYANMLHDALVDISGGLTSTYVNYTDSEQTNVKNLAALQSTLPAAKLS